MHPDEKKPEGFVSGYLALVGSSLGFVVVVVGLTEQLGLIVEEVAAVEVDLTADLTVGCHSWLAAGMRVAVKAFVGHPKLLQAGD